MKLTYGQSRSARPWIREFFHFTGGFTLILGSALVLLFVIQSVLE
ncbi:MAG: hypothetical protein WDN10_00870 [bacterium]